MKDPTAAVLEFADKISNAVGVIIVTPEYNSGYPASLKNAMDLLYAEWRRKPVALATVSNGQFGGAQVTTSLYLPYGRSAHGLCRPCTRDLRCRNYMMKMEFRLIKKQRKTEQNYLLTNCFSILKQDDDGSMSCDSII